MLLGIDIGNTNIVCALYDVKDDIVMPVDVQRFPTPDGFGDLSVYKGRVDTVYIGSVVPDMNEVASEACMSQLGLDPVFINHSHVEKFLTIETTVPEQFGIDRLLTVLAAYQQYDYANGLILIDFGTATKFEVISEDGAYKGGVICVGPDLAAEALHLRTAKLPRIDMAKPKSVVGTCTVDAIQSGLYWGYVSLIEGMVKRLQAELGGKAIVISSGGLSEIFGDDLPQIDIADRRLTLNGLYYIYKKESCNA
jgi:type III pantothenate kinase